MWTCLFFARPCEIHAPLTPSFQSTDGVFFLMVLLPRHWHILSEFPYLMDVFKNLMKRKALLSLKNVRMFLCIAYVPSEILARILTPTAMVWGEGALKRWCRWRLQTWGERPTERDLRALWRLFHLQRRTQEEGLGDGLSRPWNPGLRLPALRTVKSKYFSFVSHTG